MNTMEEIGNWHMMIGALVQKFASLTENDQMFKEGEKQEVFGKFQINLGKTEEELDKIIATL